MIQMAREGLLSHELEQVISVVEKNERSSYQTTAHAIEELRWVRRCFGEVNMKTSLTHFSHRYYILRDDGTWGLATRVLRS